MTILDTVIVGAGQAGLGVSYFLQQNGRKHIVFEQGQVGESWLSQRWDSFKLNTPNFMNVLPGLHFDGLESDGFWRPDELVHHFQRYIEHFQLPVRTGVTVVSVEQSEDEGHFIVKTRTNGEGEESVTSRSVVIASGSQRTPKIPSIQSRLPNDIVQLHTAGYRSASALPPGAIVIVGSGQSGCQIAEDLLAAGRAVYLCTSKVGRAPRRYRGRDILEWWIDMKFIDVTLASLEDESISRAAQPQVSGLGRYGHTVSLQQLARQGVVILGRLLDVNTGTLVLSDDAAAHVRFADELSQRLKDGVDAYLEKAGITPPPLEDDPADAPDPQADCVSSLRRLNLRDEKVSTIIWTTGFTADFSWIHLPVLDENGRPVHQRGVSPVCGLYFIGFPWLNSRKSGIIYGIAEDAGYIANTISEQLA
ncbi:MAG TPA: NAD(P)/FAD-dependent oxidoreductase [Anaerolineae bacterium]|nr:NAD(P)/FAD-dependent oxidoreductase [Anaerolineae bacterium]